MCYLPRMRVGCCVILASFCALIAAPIAAQEKAEEPMRGFTGYPPSVYMHFFFACASDAPCAQTDKFHINQVPTGCCVLIVTTVMAKGQTKYAPAKFF